MSDFKYILDVLEHIFHVWQEGKCVCVKCKWPNKLINDHQNLFHSLGGGGSFYLYIGCRENENLWIEILQLLYVSSAMQNLRTNNLNNNSKKRLHFQYWKDFLFFVKLQKADLCGRNNSSGFFNEWNP